MIIHLMPFVLVLKVHSCICDYDADFYTLSDFIGNECINLQMLNISLNQNSEANQNVKLIFHEPEPSSLPK